MPDALTDLHTHMLDEVNRAIDILTLGGNEAITSPRERPRQPRYRRIVVAYDGSEGSKLALAHARAFAKAHGSHVFVVSAYSTPDLNTPTAMGFGWYPEFMGEYARAQEDTKRLARDAVAELERANVEAEASLLRGSPAREIAEFAKTNRADLIVTGAVRRSRLDRALLGSTSTAVLERAPCSVLLARAPPGSRPILAPTDGSHVSYRAVAHALHLASLSNAELVVQHVLAYPEEAQALPVDGFLKAVQSRLELPSPPPRVRYVLDAGDPAKRILERAETESVGTIVMGAHGKGAIERFFVGSVSRRVAAEAPANVLVVKEPHGG